MKSFTNVPIFFFPLSIEQPYRICLYRGSGSGLGRRGRGHRRKVGGAKEWEDGTELFHGGDRVVLHGQNFFGIIQGVALVLEHLRSKNKNLSPLRNLQSDLPTSCSSAIVFYPLRMCTLQCNLL